MYKFLKNFFKKINHRETPYNETYRSNYNKYWIEFLKEL